MNTWAHEAAEARREHAIAAIVTNRLRGLIGEPTAIRQLRAQGLTEPEIWEWIG